MNGMLRTERCWVEPDHGVGGSTSHSLTGVMAVILWDGTLHTLSYHIPGCKAASTAWSTKERWADDAEAGRRPERPVKWLRMVNAVSGLSSGGNEDQALARARPEANETISAHHWKDVSDKGTWK